MKNQRGTEKFIQNIQGVDKAGDDVLGHKLRMGIEVYLNVNKDYVTGLLEELENSPELVNFHKILKGGIPNTASGINVAIYTNIQNRFWNVLDV